MHVYLEWEVGLNGVQLAHESGCDVLECPDEGFFQMVRDGEVGGNDRVF